MVILSLFMASIGLTLNDTESVLIHDYFMFTFTNANLMFRDYVITPFACSKSIVLSHNYRMRLKYPNKQNV